MKTKTIYKYIYDRKKLYRTYIKILLTSFLLKCNIQITQFALIIITRKAERARARSAAHSSALDTFEELIHIEVDQVVACATRLPINE